MPTAGWSRTSPAHLAARLILRLDSLPASGFLAPPRRKWAVGAGWVALRVAEGGRNRLAL